MNSQRLQLALERLTASDWKRLETFASEFLVSEFPDLRTTASPSGDGGKDAEIFTLHGAPIHALQYSVTPEWEKKILKTAKRLKDTHPAVQILTYVTNELIGANADELKKVLRRDYELNLDIRDRNYFLDRFRLTPATEKASESLATDLVDPLLAEVDAIKKSTSALTAEEARAALVLLSLQLKDDTQEKGLTKLSFEAMVRAALTETDANKRMPKEDLYSRVRALVPSEAVQQVDELISSAIDRLKKRYLRHHPKDDTYCLTHEEAERVKKYKNELAISETELQMEILRITQVVVGEQDSSETLKAVAFRARRILERVLYSRAEGFAGAVLANDLESFATLRVQDVVLNDLTKYPTRKGSQESNPDILSALIREILLSKSTEISQYLRGLSNAYTLMAFLRVTPDVQNAIKKIFSHGEIFLDTTILLPLLAEELLLPEQGKFQCIIGISRDAGVSFFVTEGVLEELSSHIHRGLAYFRTSSAHWEGGIPFIYEAYVRSGKNPASFSKWIETFVGDKRPIDDLGGFLESRFGIVKTSLEKDVLNAPSDLRHAVDHIWHEIHEKRRDKKAQQSSLDPLTIIRLAKHDTENYVGVIQRRREEKVSPLGYTAWWLTFDRLALSVSEKLRSKHGIAPPASPVLSIDFLAQCLAIGSIRSKISKDAADSLPMMIEPGAVSFLTKDLLEEARVIRESMNGVPEHVIDRRVRDHLDIARQRMGPMATRGIDTFYDLTLPLRNVLHNALG